MIVAVKDDLQIEVTVKGSKVNIQLPDMQEIIFLWESWIEQEEVSAENFLETKGLNNPYYSLVGYFQDNGWDIVKSNFSQQ